MDLPPGYGYPAPAASTNGLAIASLVLSIVCLVGIGSIVGIILGFVSRSQINRSRGTQRGAGLGLAGIIVGFVTLALVLTAVAIPTFLGVRASTASVVRLPLAPVTLGTPQQGGPAAPIVWESRSNDQTEATPVTGGVDVTISAAGHADYLSTPVDQPFPSIQESASVAIIDRSTANGIGLGCMSPVGTDQLGFFVQSSGRWQIMEWSSRADHLGDSGSTAAVRPTGPNTVTIACRDDLARLGSSQVSLAVNGIPVANDVLRLDSPSWWPTLQLCSCQSPDTGQYLDVAYYSSPDTTATSD
jgi:hypothetical protein